MLNGTEGMKREFSTSQYFNIYWSEKVGERKETNVRMAIYPAGKGKTSSCCQKPQKAWVFCLMLFHIFLLQSRVSTIPISFPGIGVVKYHVPHSCAASQSSPWAGTRSHGWGMTSPGVRRKQGQAEPFPVSSSSPVVSPAWAPFSLIHEQIVEGRGQGKLFAFQHYI